MKNSLLFLFICTSIFLNAQPNTEVFLFDLAVKEGSYNFSNGKNISNNEGYDNQPSFINDNNILFASTRNGQTDIVSYKDNYETKTWVNFTEGGEYTPLKIPNKNAVSSVRLDPDGKQRLYAYSLSTGTSEELIEDLVVAYYTWYDENLIVSAVIEDEGLNLYVSNLTDKSNYRYQKNVGRSFHKIPNSQLVSYISKETDEWTIKSLDPVSGATKVIASTLEGVEDMCWLINGDILMGKDDKLYKLNPKTDTSWKEIASFKDKGITKITRITSNSISNKFLIAAEIGADTDESADQTDSDTTSNSGAGSNANLDAGAIVQKHIGPYNEQDLDAFANAFSENVVVSRFPNDEMYQGRETLKANYKRSFENNKGLSVHIDKRMVLKNMVVDEELATYNNHTSRQATIYSTSENGIDTMTFIQNTEVSTNPEIIVNKQLKAYNEEDLEAFVATYTKDVKLYQYPNRETSSGIQALKESYKSWFDRVDNLKAKVVSRIVVGNKVIDKEIVKANNQTFEAIAIYEVENGLISKVTFIQ